MMVMIVCKLWANSFLIVENYGVQVKAQKKQNVDYELCDFGQVTVSTVKMELC